MKIVIRPAVPADVPEIDRIQRSAKGAVVWPAADYLSYACAVALVDGRLAGFAATRSVGPAEHEILNLAVDPAAHRRGIGGALVRHAVEAAPGVWFLDVRESNDSARRFYHALGFRDAGRRPKYYQDSGEGAVVMRLQPC